MIQYGPDLDNNNTIFNYVKVYKNRVEMDKDKDKDYVLVGSYVLIDYDRDTNSDGVIDHEDFNTNFETDQNKYSQDPAFSIVGYDSTVWQKRYKNGKYVYEMVADLNLAASLGKQYLKKQAILTSNDHGWISTAAPEDVGDDWIQVSVGTSGELQIHHNKITKEENNTVTTVQETDKIPIIKYDSAGHILSIDEGSVELATKEELEEETDRAKQAEATILASEGDDWIQVSKNENKLQIQHITPNNLNVTPPVKDGINIPAISYDDKGHIINVENQQIKTEGESGWIYIGEDGLQHKQQTIIEGIYGEATKIPRVKVDGAGHITSIEEKELPVSTSLEDVNLDNLATIGQVQEVKNKIPQSTDELDQGTNNLYVSQEEKDAWNKKTSLEGYATEEYVNQAIANIKLPTEGELLPETFEALEAYYADENGNPLNIITENELVQSDYEENNENALSYIKNRPFYSKKLLESAEAPPGGFSIEEATSLDDLSVIGETTEEFWNYINNHTTSLADIKELIESIYWLNSNNWQVEEKSLKNFPDATFELSRNWSGYWVLHLYLTTDHELGYISFHSGPSHMSIFNMRNAQSGTTYYQQVYGIKFKDLVFTLDNKYLNLENNVVEESQNPITSGAVANGIINVKNEIDNTLTNDYYNREEIDNNYYNKETVDTKLDKIDEKIIKADWEENNSENWSYIYNRPFYSTKLFENYIDENEKVRKQGIQIYTEQAGEENPTFDAWIALTDNNLKISNAKEFEDFISQITKIIAYSPENNTHYEVYTKEYRFEKYSESEEYIIYQIISPYNLYRIRYGINTGEIETYFGSRNGFIYYLETLGKTQQLDNKFISREYIRSLIPQSNWEETEETSLSFIQNKPDILTKTEAEDTYVSNTKLNISNYNLKSEITNAYTEADEQLYQRSISTSALQIALSRSNWNENNEDSFNYIFNRPFYEYSTNEIDCTNGRLNVFSQAITIKEDNTVEEIANDLPLFIKVGNFPDITVNEFMDSIDGFAQIDGTIISLSDFNNKSYPEFHTKVVDNVIFEDDYAFGMGLVADGNILCVMTQTPNMIWEYQEGQHCLLPEAGIYTKILNEEYETYATISLNTILELVKQIDTKFIPGSTLPEPTTLADNTIPIVSNGAWTTTTLKLAEEAEF